MKKLSLFLAAVMLLGSVSAQDLQKSIYGVRAGVNFSNVSLKIPDFLEIDGKNRTGFNVGFSYEHLLMKENPLYLETGLYYSQKGYKHSEVDYDETYNYKTTLSYLELPLMVNYKFNVGKGFTLYPSAGLYVAVGLGGKEKEIYEEISEDEIYQEIYKYNAFGEYGTFKRADLGYRVSASASWKQIVLSIGYEGSILNIAQNYSDEDMDISLKGRTSNVFISLGYNF